MGAIPPNLPPHNLPPLGEESDKQKAIDLVQKIQKEISQLKSNIEKGASSDTVYSELQKILGLAHQLNSLKNLPRDIRLEDSVDAAETSLDVLKVQFYEGTHDEKFKGEALQSLSSLQSRYDQLLSDIKKS